MPPAACATPAAARPPLPVSRRCPPLPPSARRGASSSSSTACRCTAASSPGASASAWDWTRWSRHFAEVDQAESYASVLRFQLEEAEDFAEAAALKRALLDATAADAVSRVMAELKVRSLAASSPIPALIVNT
ncbi:protein EXECUTER 2, chloroplastic isoform X2 [Aegilops tauschii subsp. strangulata]|uniref:protein EXECUTER 2, chloroplastic isoform X2 n=1 Tax=Aegilops tauschii subsp. strangulata TaxID=200361 RepID=UPI003CC862F1